MIGIIEYGMGNIQSVINAFEYLNTEVSIVKTPSELSKIDKIILPGVGAFGQGIENLKTRGFLEVLNTEVIKNKKPFLGICLGMQLICTESFEFGHFKGIDWIKASVRRFEPELNVRVPHVGWNNLIIKKQNKLIENEKDNNLDVYFVHSYYVDTTLEDKNAVVATCEYGREFTAVLEKNNIFAVQFHPEKSQKIGLNILKRFTEL